MKAKDFTGRVIKVGDIIAYPVRQGSSMWMSKAEVLGIEEKPRYWHKDKEISLIINVIPFYGKALGNKGRVKSRLYRFDRCIVISKEKL